MQMQAGCAARDTGQRGLAERSCSYRVSAPATCLASASIGAAAQQAAVADAATRPQDRAVFESRYHPIAISIYRCGAAKRQSVSPPQSNSNMRGRYHPSPTVCLMAHYAIRRERIVLLWYVLFQYPTRHPLRTL